MLLRVFKTFATSKLMRDFEIYGARSPFKSMLLPEEQDMLIHCCKTVVEGTTRAIETNEDETQRFFYSTLDQVINEIDAHFSHKNIELYAAVSALQLENSNFLDVKVVQPLLDLVECASVEAEFHVAKTYIANFSSDGKIKLTTTKLLSEHYEALKAMPTVHLKLGVTLGASTTMCENSFFVRKLSCKIAGNQ